MDWIVVASGGVLVERKWSRKSAIRAAVKDASMYHRKVFVGYVPGNYGVMWTDIVHPNGCIETSVSSLLRRGQA